MLRVRCRGINLKDKRKILGVMEMLWIIFFYLDVTSLGNPFLCPCWSHPIIFFVILYYNYKFILVYPTPNIPFLGQENYSVSLFIELYCLSWCQPIEISLMMKRNLCIVYALSSNRCQPHVAIEPLKCASIEEVNFYYWSNFNQFKFK